MKQMVAFLALFAFFATGASAQTLPPEVVHYADTVLHNGKIVTIDDKFAIVQALAVRDGKILKTGSNQAVLRLAGPKTKRINLQGRTIIPGLIDTHSHLHEYSLDRFAREMNPKLVEPSLSGRTEEELLERIKDLAQKTIWRKRPSPASG